MSYSPRLWSKLFQVQKRSEGSADMKKALSPRLSPIYLNQVTSGTQAGFTGLDFPFPLNEGLGLRYAVLAQGGLHFRSDCAQSPSGAPLLGRHYLSSPGGLYLPTARLSPLQKVRITAAAAP